LTRLHVGDAAPDFDLTDQEGTSWRLKDLSGKRVILYFYPADDTAGCTTQACDFRDARDDLVASGYVILGVSPQNQASHDAFAHKYGLNFPLLVDERSEIARRYGAVAEDADGQATRPRVKRSTFVIDEKGTILEALYGVKARGHVDSLTDRLGLSQIGSG
jgi:peroxiredoxin Q/BCP